jgi:primase-polymerase (primpol)-like protein
MLPPEGRRKGRFEMYTSGRLLTVTGHHLTGTPTTVEDRQEAVTALHQRVFGLPEKERPVRATGETTGRRATATTTRATSQRQIRLFATCSPSTRPTTTRSTACSGPADSIVRSGTGPITGSGPSDTP